MRMGVYMHIILCCTRANIFTAQLRADLEKTRDELEKNQRKYETEVEVRDKQIYQLKALMAHFKKVCACYAYAYNLLTYMQYKCVRTCTHILTYHFLYFIAISRAVVNSCQS